MITSKHLTFQKPIGVEISVSSDITDRVCTYMVITCGIVLCVLRICLVLQRVVCVRVCACVRARMRACLCECACVCVITIGYEYMQIFIHIPVEFIWPLSVPPIEVLKVASIACASVGCCTVAIYAAILTHRHADLPMSYEAGVAYTCVVCCERT